MKRLLALAAAILVCGLTVMADEKPTKEYQDVMKSNAATTGPMGLRAHVAAKDYEAIGMDAITLKGNYTKIDAFWTQKKADDAMQLSKAGLQAAMQLEAAAKATDDAMILQAQRI